MSLAAPIDRTAYLVDDYWSEFDRYIQASRSDRDYLFLPAVNPKLSTERDTWNTSGFVGGASAVRNRVVRDRSLLIIRAIGAIWLRIVRQGATYQQLRLSQSRYLAHIYGRLLTAEMTHLVVAQNLVPYLWQAGHLHGRSFDVLMTALPIDCLQERLDLAAKLHPQSGTLNNFRVLPVVADWERAALAQARRIVTPHAELAQLWAEKTELLDWVVPVDRSCRASAVQTAMKPTVVLPTASLGRKGIYELRAALAGLDVATICVGSELERSDFWQGYDVRYLPNFRQALAQATVVVSPAWVEHQPRRILESIACGVPTIVSTACGLHGLPAAIEIPLGNVAALRAAIIAAIGAEFRS